MTEPTERNLFPAPNRAFREPPNFAGAPAPAPPKRNQGALVAIIAGAAVFLAVSTVVVVLAVRGSGTTPTADLLPASVPTTSWQQTYATTTSTSVVTSSSVPSSTPSSTVAGLTWRRVSGPAGISVEIPADWPTKPGAVPSNVQADSTQVVGDLIRFGGSTSPSKTLLASVMDSEANTPTIRDGYERLQLGVVDNSADAVVWEFVFTAKDGMNRHAIGRFWRLGQVDYVVYASSSVDSWPAMAAVYQHMVSTVSPV
ncbi:hypothetical protein [Actinocrispum wychmicini]|uniref:Uncharacterized protein n=1 Tax=Actinocrispum wychmicini TaxID=1213861 RepID=A0A4R2JRB3_9PSEU|nr:hypothetical protein [Actinocrispum wychmicini]TCO59756.1 hypothetical protein EV192_104599 [Actinocrispum wychmicini]